MSNRTPVRTLRVDDELWLAAQSAAAENGESVSDVVRAALVAYVKRSERRAAKAGAR